MPQPLGGLTTTTTAHGRLRHASARALLVESSVTLLVLAGVLAIAWIHYAGQTLARGPDQADMLLAFFHEASHAVAEEGLLAAMYTPGVRAGVSNWSNPNFNPLYPLYFNWIGADASAEATLDRLNAIIHLHLAILGAGGFLLARALGVRMLPALGVGLLLPWFPAVRAAAGWPHIIAGLSWLPWVFAFQLRAHAAATLRAALPWLAALAVVATLLVYAQPSQSLVLAVAGSAVMWGLVVSGALLRRDAAALRRLGTTAGLLSIAAVLVALATGGYLLEILRFQAVSIRWLGAYGGYVLGNEALPAGALRFHALPVSDAALVLAFEYRRGIGNAYLGCAVLLAALATFGRGPCDDTTRLARAMAGCGVIATVACFGFMAPVLAAVPLAGKIRELTWWSCLAVVVLVPVAALGMQVLRARQAAYPRWRDDPWVWLGLLAAVAGAVATASADVPYRVAGMVALACGLGALAWLRFGRGGTATATAVIAVVALASVVWTPYHHNIEFARGDATLFEPDRVQARADAAALRDALDDEDSYRIVLQDVPNAHLLTHAYSALGFRALHGGIGPAIHAKERLLASPDATVRRLYGVRYTLLPEASAAPGDRVLRPGLALRTDEAALPRLFQVTGGARVVADPAAVLAAGGAGMATPVLVAADDLPEGLDIASFAQGVAAVATPAVVENRRTRLRAIVDVAAPSLLVLNEDPDARWCARVDGMLLPAFRVNGFQTAFALAAPGRHAVVIERPARLGAPGCRG